MLEQVMADSGFPVPLVEGGDCRVFQFHSGTGEGIMTQYDLFPGVSLMYNDFHMLVTALGARDTITINACVLLTAVIFVLVNFIADCVNALLNPQSQKGGGL